MKNRSAGQVTCSISIPPDMYEAINRVADRSGASFSGIVRGIVRAWQLQQQGAEVQEPCHG